MLSISVTFALLLFAIVVESSRILFYAMHSSRSHIGSMLPLAQMLMQAGHEVHFLEATQRKEHFRFPHGITNHHFQLSNRTMLNLSSAWTKVYNPLGIDYVYQLGDDAFFEVINEHSVEVAEVLNKTWDIVFADELFAMGSFAIALRNKRIYKKPYVMFSTTVILQLFAWELALGRNFLCQPSSWTPFADDIHFDVTNIVHRWTALYGALASGISIKYGIESGNNKGLAALGIYDFSFTDLWTNAAYNFQEELDYLAFPTPISTDILNIGSHCSHANHLPLDLIEFIEDSSSKGTIYIAMGTNVRWANAPSFIIAAFKYMMRELHQYRIIFVDDNNSLKEMPSHVKVLKWAPQFDILNHNRTILFISHGGLKSVKESICSKTPVLFIPIFAEQTHNAAIATKLGFARSLNKLTLNNEKLLLIAREMLSNNRYMDSVSRIHDIFLDRPMNSLEEAVFWTNRILRPAGRRDTFKRKDIASMILYVLSQLIYGTGSAVIASKCDLGAADMMFVVQSSYDIKNDDFEDVKNFLKQHVDDLDIGFDAKQTRVGVVVFDRVHEARYRIKFGQIEKVAHLQKAIASLHRLPCGYWWCRTNPTFTAHKAVQFALNILNNSTSGNRMKKLLVILHGKEAFEEAKKIASFATFDPALRIAQVLVVTDLTDSDSSYYKFLLAYYQPYERYLGRLHQLYPNITLPRVHQTYNPAFQLPYSKQTTDGVILLQSYEFICTIRRDVCNLLFSCPRCPYDRPAIPTSKHVLHSRPNEFQTIGHENTSDAPIKSAIRVNNEDELDRNKSPMLKAIKNADMMVDLNASNSSISVDKGTQNTSESSWNNIRPPSTEPDETSWRTLTSSVLRKSESKLNPLEFRNQIPPREVIEHFESRKRSRRQTYSIYPVLRQDQCSCSIRANMDEEKLGIEPEDTELFLNPLRLDEVKSSTARDPNMVMSGCKQHSLPSSLQTIDVSCEGSGDGDDQQGQGTSSLDNDLSSSARHDESSVTEAKLSEASRDGPQLYNVRQNAISAGEKSFQAGVRKWLGQMEQTDEMNPAKSSRWNSPQAMSTTMHSSRLGFPDNFTILKDAVVESDRQIEAASQYAPPKEGHNILELTSHSLADESNKSTRSSHQAAARAALSTEYLLSGRHETEQLESSSDPWVAKWRTSSSSSQSKNRIHNDSAGRWLSTVATSASSLQATKRCVFSGVDMIVYVDDSTAMPETEFRKFRQFLKELYYSFESNWGKCREVSRLAVLKNRQNGSVFTYLHLKNSLDKLQVSIHLSKMEYAGCDLEENLHCQKALANAYVLGTTLHATEQGGRRRALLIATSRRSARMRAVQFDLREAVEYAQRNHVDVYVIGIGEQNFEDLEELKMITRANATFAFPTENARARKLTHLICTTISTSEQNFGEEAYCQFEESERRDH